jgi:hypothetical protein
MARQISDLVVCKQAFQYDDGGVPLTVHEGAIMRTGHKATVGHEAFFEPVTLIVVNDPDLPLSVAKVMVIGDAELGSGHRRPFTVLAKARPPEMRW